MEKIVEQGLLYDFYGELLTEHQCKVYEDVVFDDLSPSEIVGELGINRQGVYGLIKRCGEILEEYEAKPHLMTKSMKIRDMVRGVEHLADEYARTGDMALVGRIHGLLGGITGTLQPAMVWPLGGTYGF